MVYVSPNPAHHTVRLRDYLKHLSAGELEAERERFDRSDYADECSFQDFLGHCFDCQIGGTEPRKHWIGSDGPFEAAYWKLDERVVDVLTNSIHPTSTNGFRWQKVKNGVIKYLPIPAPATQPRDRAGDPPPYKSSSQSNRATQLPPYATIPASSTEDPQPHQWLGSTSHQERGGHWWNHLGHSGRRDDHSGAPPSGDKRGSAEWSDHVKHG